MQARTAKDWGWPVTVLVAGRPNDGTVNIIDRMVAMALTMFEQSLCPGCGLPAHKTRGDANVGRFEAHDDEICHGCEPLDSMREDKNRAKFPGQKVYLAES